MAHWYRLSLSGAPSGAWRDRRGDALGHAIEIGVAERCPTAIRRITMAPGAVIEVCDIPEGPRQRHQKLS